MNYTVVFDVVGAGFNQGGPICYAFVFVIIGALMVSYREELFPDKPPAYAFVFMGFAILFTTLIGFSSWHSYSTLASALREGRCEVTQGRITEFHPVPSNGKGSEWFVVGGKRFEYAEYDGGAGFHQTASRGGPIEAWITVRVHHVERTIVRLEIAKGSYHPEPPPER